MPDKTHSLGDAFDYFRAHSHLSPGSLQTYAYTNQVMASMDLGTLLFGKNARGKVDRPVAQSAPDQGIAWG